MHAFVLYPEQVGQQTVVMIEMFPLSKPPLVRGLVVWQHNRGDSLCLAAPVWPAECVCPLAQGSAAGSRRLQCTILMPTAHVMGAFSAIARASLVAAEAP